MLRRKCKELKHTFSGFYNKYTGVKNTSPIIVCSHGREIKGSCHHYLNYVKNGCNMCSATNIRSDIIDKAKAQSNVTEVIVPEGGDVTGFLYYRCQACSHDWFVKNKYCDGWFKIRATRLNSGNLTCRCSGKFFGGDKYKLGKAILGHNDSPSVKVISLYKDEEGRDRFKVNCSIHGVTTQDDHTCYTGYLPKCCSQTGWYVHKGKEGFADFLYVGRLTSDGESLIKIGRSFDIHSRRDKLEHFYQTELLYVVTSTHSEIWEYEKFYHRVFRNYRETPAIRFAGESEVFSEEVLKLPDFKLLVIDLINGY